MAAKRRKTEEKRCRKKIATLLSLMGFHDDDPETTIKFIRQKLIEIQQKEAKNSKLSTNIKKVTFKFGGKTSSVIHLETLVQEKQTTNFSVVVPKQKRSNIQRLPNSKFHTLSSSADDDSKMMINYDDIHHSADQQSIQDKRSKKMEKDVIVQNPSSDHTMMIINDNDDDGGGGVMYLNDFITSIGGSKPELVIEKQLTSSDVAKNHGRLLIPALQVINPATFLTKQEKWLLANRKNISVSVFDPQRRKYTLNLGQWNMTENKNYVLKTQWNQIVSVNKLKENMVLQVISFRGDEQLCIALVRVQ